MFDAYFCRLLVDYDLFHHFCIQILYLILSYPRFVKKTKHTMTSNTPLKLSSENLESLEDEVSLTQNVEIAVCEPIPWQPSSGYKWLGLRRWLSLLAFFGFANVYAMRVNLSVAIVAMVNSSAIPHVNTTDTDVCPAPDTNTSSSSNDGEFVWTEAQQGIILGSFFWGYVASNLLGGRLAEMFGGHIILGLGVGATGVLTLFSPVVARASTELFIALRVAEGLTEGVTYPAMMSLMASWTPPLERTQTITFIMAGAYLGTVISLPVSGYLAASSFLGGWPAAFYIFGALSLLWALIWAAVATRTPDVHPWISSAEKLYISTSLQHELLRGDQKLSVPWRAIFTSKPFYAILVAHTCNNWVFYMLLTELPTYLDNILHLDIKQDALLAALPYAVMWLMCIGCGLLCDHLRAPGRLSTTTVRKLFNSIGLLGPGVFLVAVTYTGCNAVLSLTMLTIAVGLSGAANSGYGCSHLDISPNFAGTLMGLTNTAATVSGFLAPIVVGALISGQETLDRWRLVFWIAVVIVVVGNTFYVIFYVGDVQPWNEPNYASGPRRRSGSEEDGEADGGSVAYSDCTDQSDLDDP